MRLLKNSGRRLKRATRAISPVIAVLLMIVIAVAASLVAYAWVMGYIGFTTSKVGRAILIQSIHLDKDTGIVTVYAQNVGDSPITLSNVYVNDMLNGASSVPPLGDPLAQGATAIITLDGTFTGEEKMKVKVAGADGTFTETTEFSLTSGYGGTPPTPTYIYYKPITFTAAAIGTQPNFPALISISNDAEIAAKSTDGSEIYFTSDAAGTNKLDHDLLSYFEDGSGADVVAWVKVPSLVSGGSIYVWYGATSAAVENPTGVWDSYEGVWHFDEGSGLTSADSTSNGNDGDLLNTAWTTGPNAAMSSALSFNGATSRDTLPPSSLTMTNAVTVEGWIKCTNTFGRWFMKSEISGAPYDEYGIGPTGGGDIRWELATSAGIQYIDTNALDTTTWHYVVGTWDGAIMKTYVNGVQQLETKAVSGTITTLAPSATIGYGAYGGAPHAFLNGSIDELRISSTARLLDWIQTEYNNMNDPAGFINPLGAEVQVAV
jgi:FlaG/FlaF family flagellin (archaellin)